MRSSGGTKRPTEGSSFTALAALAVLGLLLARPGVIRAAEQVEFRLPASELGDALSLLGMQAGLQIIYDHGLVAGRISRPLEGRHTVTAALDLLLRSTGLRWRTMDQKTIIVYRVAAFRRPAPVVPVAPVVEVMPEPPRDIVEMEEIAVLADRLPSGNVISSAAFGFQKSLAETPRSISVVSEDAIDIHGLSAVEELSSVAPGVFTTTRYGIQGGVDVRNAPADSYFRGMKRLTLQGHGRSVLAALDSIEVVGGPSSPLYGMGKFGGYTNVVPKSGRVRAGTYMIETQGHVQVVGGRYGRRELSLGVGGPVAVPSRTEMQGGYYLYGLVEDSDSYAKDVPVKHGILQGAFNLENFLQGFRLEGGVNYQHSRTAGALTNRLTQDLIDNGRYISGVPLVNLDLDANGSIEYDEMHAASPVSGLLSQANQPLIQTFAWPLDAEGRPVEDLAQFPRIAGIPQSMFDYLLAHPEADPTGLLSAQGPGGPLPLSGAVPAGMPLDPSSVRYTPLNPRHSSAYERESNAKYFTAYADMVRDQDPDFTIRNQLFFDSMNQYKLSDQPLWRVQNVSVIEEKLTLTRRLRSLPQWLQLNSLFSMNLRTTASSGRTIPSDYGNHRTDAMSASWNDTPGGLVPNTTINAASIPFSSRYRSRFSEFGVGTLLDIDLLEDTNLLIGGRLDQSHARNTDLAGRFNPNAGTSANPGAYVTSDDTVSGWDGGLSWTLTLSHALPFGLRPYATMSESSIMLDGSNNSLTNAIIQAGHVGTASLREAGLKAALPESGLMVSAAWFRQGRTEVDDDSAAELLTAYASATTTWGWQAQIEWAPLENFLLSAHAQHMITKYTPNTGAVIVVDASTVGFQDVVDEHGNVIYPAEAFLHGGRVRLVLPPGMSRYRKKQGSPDTQIGLNAVFRFSSGLGMTFKSMYLSDTCTGRLCLVRLPQSLVFDVGAFWESRSWDMRLMVSNVTDQRHFRARTGDTLGEVLAQAMPGRRWQGTLRYKF